MRQDDKTTARTMTTEEHNAILRDQLSGMVERLAAMEMKLDLEVANRDSLVAAEVERLMPSIKTRIREEVKGELGDVDAMRRDLEMREARLRQDMELMAERLVAQVRQRYAEEKEKVLSSGIFQMQDVQKITLEAFTAAVEGDAYAGYDWVGKAGRVLCRCAAHMRRGFERAMNENPTLATPAIALIQDIYAVVSIVKMRGLEGDAKTALRRELADPNWKLLKLWCGQNIVKVPEETLIHRAMGYLLRHYDELTAYLDIAGMPVDNNDTERAIRAMVMGKQAYLFCRTDEACQRAALMYSMLGACKVLGKNAEKWLAHALKHVGSTKPENLHLLLPENWTE